MPPIVTEPTLIRCQVNSKVSIQILAQDPNGDLVTYSLRHPRPARSSIGSSETLVHFSLKSLWYNSCFYLKRRKTVRPLKHPSPCWDLTLSAPGDGFLTWTPLTTQPVQLTIRVSDELSSSLFTPILRICNCLNGGSCQYDSITENHHQGMFQVPFLLMLSLLFTATIPLSIEWNKQTQVVVRRISNLGHFLSF